MMLSSTVMLWRPESLLADSRWKVQIQESKLNFVKLFASEIVSLAGMTCFETGRGSGCCFTKRAER